MGAQWSPREEETDGSLGVERTTDMANRCYARGCPVVTIVRCRACGRFVCCEHREALGTTYACKRCCG
jgi:hypothetical protein